MITQKKVFTLNQLDREVDYSSSQPGKFTVLSNNLKVNPRTNRPQLQENNKIQLELINNTSFRRELKASIQNSVRYDFG